MNSHEALEHIKEGNIRYRKKAKTLLDNLEETRIKTAIDGQNPHTIILTCSDSRVPPELIFDQGIGELFVIRVAGNLLGPSEIGSVEFAVDHLESPLFVVLGHTSCGAVNASFSDNEAPKHVDKLIEPIKELVDQIKTNYPTLQKEEQVDKVIKANVRNSMNRALELSTVIKDKVKSGDLLVVGAIYHLETGEVDWMDD